MSNFHNETIIWLEKIQRLANKAKEEVDREHFIKRCKHLIEEENKTILEHYSTQKKLFGDYKSSQEREAPSHVIKKLYYEYNQYEQNTPDKQYPDELIITDEERFKQIYYDA